MVVVAVFVAVRPDSVIVHRCSGWFEHPLRRVSRFECHGLVRALHAHAGRVGDVGRSVQAPPRLDEIQDLPGRRARAEHEAWLGEVEGIDLTLTFLRQKREETKRLARIAPVELGIPVIAAPR